MPLIDPDAQRAYHKSWRKKNRDGLNAQRRDYYQRTKKTRKPYVKAYYQNYYKNPDRAKKRDDARLERLYQLSPEEREALDRFQGGLCAICTRPLSEVRIVVDHNHSEDFVRGLLCQGCNTGLGAFKDDPKRLVAAVRYLQCSPAERLFG